MKRTALWALLLAVFILTACGGADTADTPAAPDPPPAGELPEAETPPGPAETPSPDPTETPGQKGPYPIAVLDNESCAVTVTGVTPPAYEGAPLHVEAELVNKSEEPLNFTVKDPGCAVNGVQGDASMLEEVPAGETAVSYIAVRPAYGWGDAVDYGIGEYGYTDISLALRVYNADYEEMGAALFHLYPYGEDNAVRKEFAADPDCQPLFDDEYAAAYVLSVSRTDGEGPSPGGYAVSFCFVNKTDTVLRLGLSTGDPREYALYLNGTVGFRPWWSVSVMADAWCFDTLTIGMEDLAELGIEELTDLRGTIQIAHKDDPTVICGYEDIQLVVE